MALQTSGAISLNDIHQEAGGTSGTQAAINDQDIRDLISKASGVQMSFSEWYGAASGLSQYDFGITNGADSNTTNGVATYSESDGSKFPTYTRGFRSASRSSGAFLDFYNVTQTSSSTLYDFGSKFKMYEGGTELSFNDSANYSNMIGPNSDSNETNTMVNPMNISLRYTTASGAFTNNPSITFDIMPKQAHIYQDGTSNAYTHWTGTGIPESRYGMYGQTYDGKGRFYYNQNSSNSIYWYGLNLQLFLRNGYNPDTATDNGAYLDSDFYTACSTFTTASNGGFAISSFRDCSGNSAITDTPASGTQVSRYYNATDNAAYTTTPGYA